MEAENYHLPWKNALFNVYSENTLRRILFQNPKNLKMNQNCDCTIIQLIAIYSKDIQYTYPVKIRVSFFKNINFE